MSEVPLQCVGPYGVDYRRLLRSTRTSTRTRFVQGYLAHKKTPPPRRTPLEP